MPLIAFILVTLVVLLVILWALSFVPPRIDRRLVVAIQVVLLLFWVLLVIGRIWPAAWTLPH